MKSGPVVAIFLASATFGALAGDAPKDAPKGEPKDAVKPTNLEKLNTDADEDDPFALDGLNLYYATNKSGRWEIMQSKRAGVTNPWPAGKSQFSGKDVDFRSPFIQGNALYYATNKVPDEKLKALKNFDIVKKTGNLAPLPLIGISEPEDELHPWITKDGKELYFSRKLKDGWTLFVARGPNPGPIGKAKEVGFPAGYHHATLTPGGTIMYLEGPLEKGRVGLFKSKRAKSGEWSKPEPLTSLNHPEAKRGDMSPSLSADGVRLYFASDRPGGKGGLDIWSVKVSDLKEK